MLSQFRNHLLHIILGAINVALAASSNAKLNKLERPFLLIVGMDAFRWDFIDKAHTPNFDLIIEDGVRAKHVKNVFPTKSAPNWYTIVSGLYVESHGVTNNHVYDPKIDPNGGIFIDAKCEDPRMWEAAEPIWITNQRQGGRSGLINFPFGMNVKFDKMVATYTTNKYRNDTTKEERVDRIVELFANGSINLGIIYYSAVDHACHMHGPESKEAIASVEEMDKIAGYLVKKLKEKDLYDIMNIMFVADHGQVEVNLKKAIFMNDHIDPSLYLGLKDNPMYSVFPYNVSKTDEIIEKLSNVEHLTVYTKDTMPENFHYKHNDRIPPIMVMTEVGWVITKDRSEKKSWNGIRGSHGYSNDLPEMWPFFVARGPGFKKGIKSAEPFNSVDIYSLMCHLMQLEAAPHNGSLENVKHLLASQADTEGGPSAQYGVRLFICVLVIVIETIVLIGGILWYRRQRKSAHRLIHDVQLEGLLDNEEES